MVHVVTLVSLSPLLSLSTVGTRSIIAKCSIPHLDRWRWGYSSLLCCIVVIATGQLSPVATIKWSRVASSSVYICIISGYFHRRQLISYQSLWVWLWTWTLCILLVLVRYKYGAIYCWWTNRLALMLGLLSSSRTHVGFLSPSQLQRSNGLCPIQNHGSSMLLSHNF
jgi:hypothetical protein